MDIKQIMKPKYPEYKRIKVLMPHCPDCKEQLQGNNSIVQPWECKCGIWESNWIDPMKYKIKIKPL